MQERPDIATALRGLVREVVREVLAEERASHTGGLELLTTAEASVIAKVKPATLRTWIKLGQLKAQRFGRCGRGVRVARADLDAFLGAGHGRRKAKRETAEDWAQREATRALSRR